MCKSKLIFTRIEVSSEKLFMMVVQAIDSKSDKHGVVFVRSLTL